MCLDLLEQTAMLLCQIVKIMIMMSNRLNDNDSDGFVLIAERHKYVNTENTCVHGD